jgi:hypothetical protein
MYELITAQTLFFQVIFASNFYSGLFVLEKPVSMLTDQT